MLPRMTSPQPLRDQHRPSRQMDLPTVATQTVDCYSWPMILEPTSPACGRPDPRSQTDSIHQDDYSPAQFEDLNDGS